MARLSVNVNKIATLRNTRPNLNVPDLARLARVALDAGAAGLTVHPRPDERHVRAVDVAPMAELAYAYGVEFNVEGNPFEGRYVEHCRATRPTQCTLVPDSVEQGTSDHGWDLARDAERLRPLVAELSALGCRVSLFMDVDAPDDAWLLARDVGAHRVELYTEPYAAAFARGEDGTALFSRAAKLAHAAGLGVNAGHDLSLANLPPFVRAVPEVEEVSIGHALVADALELGLAEAVRRYTRAASAV